MNAITLVNAALHALLISAVGWMLIRCCVRDARHRAWSTLLVLLAAVVTPLFMETRTETRAPDHPVVTKAPAPAVSTWEPDWKIPTVALEPVRVSAPVEPESPPAPNWTAADVVWWAGIVWIAGSIVMALWHGIMSLFAWHWRKRLRELSSGERALIPSQASLFDMHVFEGAGCPCVVGLWRPVVAVPRHIIGTWTERQWAWLLRHEGSHIRGRDTLIVWLLGWVKALLWWNPFVHALVELWSQSREEICDRAAVADHQDSTAYWSFLLDIAAGTRATSPALLHMAASRPARRLRARMTAMLALRSVRENTSPWFMLATSVVMASLIAVVSCMGLKAQNAPGLASGALETRFFKVAPDFLGAGYVTAQELLSALGVPFPEGSSATYVRATSQVIVVNTMANLDRVDAELAALKAEREASFAQVYITSKWVEMDAAPSYPNVLELLPVGSETLILTDPQYQVVLRALAQRKGVDLMSAPSVTTRFGQSALVEVIREVPGTVRTRPVEWASLDPTLDFVGVSLGVLVHPADEKLELEVAADMGEFANPALRGWRTQRAFKVPENAAVVHLQKKHTTMIEEGHTLMLRVGDSPLHPGRVVMLFVTPMTINPAGERQAAGGARERAVRERALREKVDRLIAEGLTARSAASEAIKAGNTEDAHKKLLTAFRALGAAASLYPRWKAEVVSGQLKEIEQSILNLGFPAPGRAIKILNAQPPAAEGAVLIDVKWIDFPKGRDDDPFSWLQIVSPLLELKPADPAVVAPAVQTVSAMMTPPGIMAIAGVFTDKQFNTVLPALLKQEGARLTSAPPVEIESGENTDIKQDGVDDFKVVLEPVVGADGHTIDLKIGVPRSYARKGDSTTTAVTIWSGQTVALAGSLSDDKSGDKNRIVFVTAKLKKDPPQPR